MQTHIIGKQIIELGLGPEQDAFAMQQEISWVLKNKVMPRVEALLDRMISPDIVIRLDELELDLGYINPDNLERDFAETLLKHFEKILQEKLEEIASSAGLEKAHKIPTQLSVLDAWKFYLEKGFMPWWVEEKDWKIWESKIVGALSKATPGIISQLRRLTIGTTPLIQRIVWQFSRELQLALVRNHSPKVEQRVQELARDLVFFVQELPDITISRKEAEEYFWIEILTLLLEDKFKDNWLSHLLRAFFKHLSRKRRLGYKDLVQQACELSLTDVKEGQQKLPDYLEKVLIQLWKEISTKKLPEKIKSITNPELEKESQEILSQHDFPQEDVKPIPPNVAESSSIFIQNAGIVLVHPFLPILFEELGYTKSKDFVDEDMRQRAIHLLQYLANGKFEANEPELSLNKLLCGLPLNMPVKQQIVLTEAEKEEADHLLETVVGHWKSLKNTSPDGLRVNYFIREGKLAFTEMGWKLQIEQKTQDIMLGRLPWGISMVKMPWMPDVLRVEWN